MIRLSENIIVLLQIQEREAVQIPDEKDCLGCCSEESEERVKRDGQRRTKKPN